jgi:hypothetical protein
MVPGHLIPAVPCPLLFPGGPGKTNSREDFASLMNDLESKIFAASTTTRSCILATATTPRWVANGRTSPSGGNAVGKHTTWFLSDDRSRYIVDVSIRTSRKQGDQHGWCVRNGCAVASLR